MAYQESMNEIKERRKAIMDVRTEIQALQSKVEPQQVKDYIFSTTTEDVTLSSLFADKDTLFVIHNMGKSCVNCTQWADGFNGVLDHLLDRAAFVVSSPDEPQVQKHFAQSRGWKFKMVSHQGTSFAEDMGYRVEYDGKLGFWPGVSVFKKAGDGIVRVSDAAFGPWDDYNPVLNLFELIPGGVGDWEPQYSYGN